MNENKFNGYIFKYSNTTDGHQIMLRYPENEDLPDQIIISDDVGANLEIDFKEFVEIFERLGHFYVSLYN